MVGPSKRRYSALQITPGRRFSALVPDAVARRLSTLGLTSRNNPTDELVEQGKALCAQYMKTRAGEPGRRWRWRDNIEPWAGARLVFPRLSCLGKYLERERPHLYTAIGRYAERPPPASSELDPADLVYSIGIELFKDEITWGKVVTELPMVVSLMAVCGAMSKSAAGCGAIDIIPTLLEAATATMQGTFLHWLQQNGGWYGLVQHCQPIERVVTNKQQQMSPNIVVVTGTILLILFTIFFFRYTLF